jgi:hypothetical protein
MLRARNNTLTGECFCLRTAPNPAIALATSRSFVVPTLMMPTGSAVDRTVLADSLAADLRQEGACRALRDELR